MSTGTDSAAGEGLPSRRAFPTTHVDRHDQVARHNAHGGFRGHWRTLGCTSVFSPARGVVRLQAFEELFDAEPRLPDDRPERARRKLAVQWDDHDSALFGSELQVASALTRAGEASSFERPSRLFTRDPREPRAHAGTSTGVMMSGSGTSKSGSSSK